MRYVNYLEADAVDPAGVAYGSNLPKLRELKKKYDPDNFFRQNVNITAGVTGRSWRARATDRCLRCCSLSLPDPDRSIRRSGTSHMSATKT